MTRFLISALCALLFSPLAACAKSGKTDAKLVKTDEDKTLYALGLILAGNVKPLGLSPVEYELVKQGFEDATSGKKPQIELQEWGPKVSMFANKRQSAQAEKDSAKEKELSKGFIAKAVAEAGAQAKPSGLIYKQLKAGAGESPKATDKVKVHYEGKLINGTIFDSSVKRGEPAEFPLTGVIPCWTEGVQLMKVGEKAQLICPAAIAYGDRGHPPTIPGGATLVFEVELLAITTAPAAAPAIAK